MKLLEYAKLDPNDHLPLSQSLVFSNTYGSENNVKLMEVDSELLKYLSEGKK